MDQQDSGAIPLERPMTLDAGSVRWHTANFLLERSDIIVADTVSVFPYSGPQRLEAEYCLRLGAAFVRQIADAVRGGSLDPRSSGVSDLLVIFSQRLMTPDQVFTFAYLTMSTSIDELSIDPRMGATTESWPQVAQIVRRGVFDVLAAWAAKVIDAPSIVAITDPLTTLHTRAVLEVALFKEGHRAERFEHWLSMILMDVDSLSEINRVHGYGVGDRILERMGILTRSYFRQHDWIARYSEDAIAILLPETSPDDAMTLAERTRAMIHDRLTFKDYRTDQRAAVTVSVAVVSACALAGEPIDADRFLREAEATVERAKSNGRNRVERSEIAPRLMSIADAATILKTDLQGIEGHVASGRLEPISAGGHVRLERAAVFALRDRRAR